MVVSIVANHAKSTSSSCEASGSLVFAGLVNAINPTLAAGPGTSSMLAPPFSATAAPVLAANQAQPQAAQQQQQPQADAMNAMMEAQLAEMRIGDFVEALKSQRDRFIKAPSMKKGRLFDWSFRQLPRMDTRLALQYVPTVNSAMMAIVRSFNKEMGFFEGPEAEQIYHIPAKHVMNMRNAILDSVIENFKKLTGSDDFKMMANAAQTFSGEWQKTYKSFFERLQNRKIEASQTAATTTSTPLFTSLLSSPSAATETSTTKVGQMRRLPIFREIRNDFIKKLEDLEILDALRTYNESLNDREGRKYVHSRAARRKMVKERYAPLSGMKEVFAELFTEDANYSTQAQAAGMQAPAFDQLPTWEKVKDYMRSCAKSRERWETIRSRFAALHLATESIITTVKPEDRVLEHKLQGITNPAWTTVVKHYLQGALRARMTSSLNEMAKKSGKPVEIVQARIGPDMPYNNLYYNFVKKFSVFQRHGSSLKDREDAPVTFEEVIASGRDGLLYLMANARKGMWRNGKFDVSGLYTIKPPLKDDAPITTIETYQVDPNSEEGKFIQQCLLKHVEIEGEKFFNTVGVPSQDPQVKEKGYTTILKEFDTFFSDKPEGQRLTLKEIQNAASGLDLGEKVSRALRPHA